MKLRIADRRFRKGDVLVRFGSTDRWVVAECKYRGRACLSRVIPADATGPETLLPWSRTIDRADPCYLLVGRWDFRKWREVEDEV